MEEEEVEEEKSVAFINAVIQKQRGPLTIPSSHKHTPLYPLPLGCLLPVPYFPHVSGMLDTTGRRSPT